MARLYINPVYSPHIRLGFTPDGDIEAATLPWSIFGFASVTIDRLTGDVIATRNAPGADLRRNLITHARKLRRLF